MKDPVFIPISKKRYDDIIRYISDITSLKFRHLNLSDDIANYILAKLIKAAPTDPMGIPADFINSIFPKAVEDVFNYYHRVAFQFCLTKTQDPSLSEDISQEVITLLLSSQHHINNVYGWIRQVTHNLLCKHYASQTKEKDLYNMLCVESSSIHNMMTSENTFDIEGLNPQAKNEILASQEYQNYTTMLAFDGISDYATSMNVSEKVAQKRKDKVIRNLRSKILLAIGWEASREILNYNQYHAIQKFIRTILKEGHSTDGIQPQNKIKLKLTQVMNGIEKIDDWGINMVDNGRFRLHIFHLTQNKQPIIATFFIILSERNQVRIENCQKNEIIGAHPIPANLHIPKKMGRALWSYEKIISLLK
ncbi:MAG: sigma-70 family RNA polymerase sigma factor [Candidatus Cloacimonetes bacterium]|nr:sigma-70 family RNA polymerase sigma factor [Candidatus Cloacimonadota bacterium]